MMLFLKTYTKLIIPTLLVLLLGFTFALGHRSGSLKQRAYYQQILLKQQQDYANKLGNALKQQQIAQARADQISQQHAQFVAHAQTESNQLKKEIQNVIKKDNGDCNRLGTYSLQHYNKALGY